MAGPWQPLREALLCLAEQQPERLLRVAPEIRRPAEELLRQLSPEGAAGA